VTPEVVEGLLMLAGGAAAGVFGSLLGLGGGVLIVPLLTLGFGLPLREAVGVSLIAVIMTSSAAAAVYLERRVANLRLGMTLELFTAAGAIAGGLIAFAVEERVIAFLFAALLGYVSITMLRHREKGAVVAASSGPAIDVDSDEEPGPEPLAPVGLRERTLDRLSGDEYRVRHLGRGIVGSTGAGVLSALLGIGGGMVKVPLMHMSMGVPLRVATATSNVMIGITAAASAVIYVLRGQVDPYVAGPIAIGVFIGATLGSRVAHRIGLRYLRLLFVIVLVYTAFQMLSKALT
jgi:uncharacterized membrane protein YfcA